uniref:Putative carbon-nitrogen hydrolase n=1 Tax=Xenopsylla cheopis TaxID=163159 RepID=A0A6M2DYN1_XENCH
MFKIQVISSLVLVIIVGYSLQETKTTYKAGVVEYYPSSDKNFDNKVQNNLDAYKNFTNNATKEKVDILVFPEGTLNGGIKDREEAKNKAVEFKFPNKEILCPPSHTKPSIMETLSCQAKANKIYVVVNLSEKERCTPQSQQAAQDDRPCATDGNNYYNTDVAFDRNGAIVARYRKYNLFSEKHFNTTKAPEHSTFVTDFNVTFGLFTCFDIMFNEPTLAMVREGVKDFIFPTMWFSELPFLTALQVQEYWSHSNDVNLLAAGASNTALGSGGSGIYAGRMGPLITYMSIPQNENKENENNKLLIADVPILKYTTPQKNDTKPNGEKTERNALFNADISSRDAISGDAVKMDKFILIKDDIKEYASKLIGKELGNQFSEEICNNELCCTFNVTSIISNKTESGFSYYQYRAIVGDVVRSFSGVTNGGIKACGIVACSGDTIETCGSRFNDSSKVGKRHIFTNIHIEGKFPNIDDVFTMPNTLSHSMKPLDNSRFIYHEEKKEGEDQKSITMDLRGLPADELQTFGIYGRDFRYDGLYFRYLL